MTNPIFSGPSVATQAISGYLEEEPSEIEATFFREILGSLEQSLQNKDLISTQIKIIDVIYQVLISRSIDNGDIAGVIFLDIDGVLVLTSEFMQSHDKAKIELEKSAPAFRRTALVWTFVVEDFVTEALHNLQRVVRSRENTAIVLTSTRRNCILVALIREIAAKTFGNYIIDKTQDTIYPKLSRGEEIALWKKEHPSVKNYVIIDDEDQFITEDRYKYSRTPLADHFVLVEGEYFSSTDADAAIEILNRA